MEGLRHIKIEGCYNLRDVGGYATRDGRRTRWRALLRSDSLHRLTPAGWRGLFDYGVRTIIDLRRPSELEYAGYQVEQAAGARYHHLPLFDDTAYDLVDRPANNLEELYRLLLDHCGAQFASVMRAIAAEGAAPALIHCAVGKDRTGLSIALALGSAGVPNETIADDYLLSGALLEPLHAEFLDYERQSGGDVERLARMLETPRETMLGTLEYLDARYGGADGYLAHVGMSEQERGALRTALLER